MSLIKAIWASLPALCRLMNDRSDCNAHHEYVRDHAAMTGELLDCGESFPRRLERFPAAGDLPFLPDLARFEWSRERIGVACRIGNLVLRLGTTVVSMRLVRDSMSFIRALISGGSVRDTATIALRADDRFDPLIVLVDLLQRSLIMEIIPPRPRS
jgi:hypothetical protein